MDLHIKINKNERKCNKVLKSKYTRGQYFFLLFMI